MSQRKRERVYAISMGSLLPMSWGPGGIARAHNYASKRDMGIQALPFRGCTYFVPRKAESGIVSLEGAWNERAGNLKKAFLRFLIADQSLPSLWDWLLFGPRHKRREMEIYYAFPYEDSPTVPRWIYHNPPKPEKAGSGLWLEISSSLHKYVREEGTLLNWLCAKDYRLVVDTLHIRRPHKPWCTVPFDCGCLYAIRTLVKDDKVDMIHFHPVPDSRELDDFMAGKATFLQPLLWALRDAGPVPVVIETHPLSWLTYDLADVRDRIHEELDG